MTESGRRVLHLGMLLSREERVEVAARLVQSVNAIAEAESAWLAIIARRAEQVVAGVARAVESEGGGGIRVDVEAEADIEQAVSWYEENRPEEVKPFLSEVAFAFKKIRRKLETVRAPEATLLPPLGTSAEMKAAGEAVCRFVDQLLAVL